MGWPGSAYPMISSVITLEFADQYKSWQNCGPLTLIQLVGW